MKWRPSSGLSPLVWLLVGLVGLVACHAPKAISTDRLLAAFNDGATDSIPDPTLGPEAMAIGRVRMTAQRFLIRGFATQGESALGANVASWLENDHVQTLALDLAVQRKQCILEQAGRSPSNAAAPEASVPTPPIDRCTLSGKKGEDSADFAQDRTSEIFRCRLKRWLTEVDQAPPVVRVQPLPVCEGTVPAKPRAGAYADLARLTGSLEIASIEVGRLIAEGLVTEAQAETGFRLAMFDAAAYLRNRKWRRSDDRPTIGIALKGGASSGTYTAGGTWRLLTLMQRYGEWKAQNDIRDEDVRFTVAAGTSAGAIIAALVDLYNQPTCYIDDRATHFRNEFGVPRSGEVDRPAVCQEYARRLLATFFTRSDEASLYCIDRRFILSLAGDQKGLMDFTKLRQLLANYVGYRAIQNVSELVLTTVDFRWGELFVQSDQDPRTTSQDPKQGPIDDVRNIEASFVLPFIARPVDHLRIQGQDTAGVFLDGGIKSEIPLLALLDRGVERAVVVGSAPPRVTPIGSPSNALAIALRYLDVSISGVTESEWNAAAPYADYLANFEERACQDLMGKSGLDEAARSRFCKGDFAGACANQDGMPRKFSMLGVFRRESVDPTFGYTFSPTQMRRLFNAGAEQVRMQCADAASFLGISSVPRETLDRWCNETPKADNDLRTVTEGADGEASLCP